MQTYKYYLHVISICILTLCLSNSCLAGASPRIGAPAETVCNSKVPFYAPPKDYKFPSMNSLSATKRYKVDRVIDGDTLRYFDNDKSISVRFLNIDCDETRDNYRIYKQAYLTERKVECVMQSGQAAKEHLQKIVDENPKGYIDIRFQGDLDKYQRRLGVLYKNGRNVNEELVRSGYCSAYAYQKKY